MNSQINPEAAEPSTEQSSGMSDRNPVVTTWGASGGQIESPAATESRMTPEGPVVSPDAGLGY